MKTGCSEARYKFLGTIHFCPPLETRPQSNEYHMTVFHPTKHFVGFTTTPSHHDTLWFLKTRGRWCKVPTLKLWKTKPFWFEFFSRLPHQDKRPAGALFAINYKVAKLSEEVNLWSCYFLARITWDARCFLATPENLYNLTGPL